MEAYSYDQFVEILRDLQNIDEADRTHAEKRIFNRVKLVIAQEDARRQKKKLAKKVAA